MPPLARLGEMWNSIQQWLLPVLEDELGELDEQHQLFITVCETCRIQVHTACYRWCGNGRPPADRMALCKAFIAKAVWDFPTTTALIDALRQRPTLRRLCGWESRGEIPGQATFSRAFAAFANDALPQNIHEAMIKEHYADKLAGHLSRDATKIDARERAAPETEQASQREASKKANADRNRLQCQLERELDANLAELPRLCDYGTKKNSKGKRETWCGYKLHIDAIDGDIPVSWLLSSASMHDSQAAIPLAQMSAGRVTSCYDLADAAYDAQAIRTISERLGHVAIIDHNPRRGAKRPFPPHQAERYKQRNSVERVNGHLHDNHGGRHVRVRGAVKVTCHLSFGLLVIAAEQLLKLLA